MEDLKKNRHAIYNLKYHLVVVTKYRHKCITKEMLEDIEAIAERLFQDKNCEILEFNGEEDHVHMLLRFPPKYSPLLSSG